MLKKEADIYKRIISILVKVGASSGDLPIARSAIVKNKMETSVTIYPSTTKRFSPL